MTECTKVRGLAERGLSSTSFSALIRRFSPSVWIKICPSTSLGWECNKIGNNITADGFTPFEDAKACQMCSRISIECLMSPRGFFHHENYSQLETAANSGCKLCTIILLAIERGGSRQFASMVVFRSQSDPTWALKLVAVGNKEGLELDLVEIRVGNTSPNYTGISNVDDTLATIGVYTDAGLILLFSWTSSALLIYFRHFNSKDDPRSSNPAST